MVKSGTSILIQTPSSVSKHFTLSMYPIFRLPFLTACSRSSYISGSARTFTEISSLCFIERFTRPYREILSKEFVGISYS